MKIYMDQLAVLQTLTCWVCATPFAVEANFHDRAAKSGRVFYCPNGHAIRYGDTELDKTKRELVAVRAAKERSEAEARDRREEAARVGKQLDRLQRRVHAGVCTRCNRTFQNVARHMATKHKAP